MGMFDYVDYEGNCPKCQHKVKDFQSKSGPCILTLLKPYEVSHFYSSCAGCGAWVTGSTTLEDGEIIEVIANLKRRIEALWDEHGVITLNYERVK